MEFRLQTCHPENATAAIGQRGGIRAAGHNQTATPFRLLPFNGPLHSESCLIPNLRYSPFAASSSSRQEGCY